MDFQKLLTSLGCTYFGTSESGSTLNGIVGCPIYPIAEVVRAKLYNSGLRDSFGAMLPKIPYLNIVRYYIQQSTLPL